MKFEDYKRRVKDLRPRHYGEGAIVGYVNDGEEYWIVRWDNPGLGSEWLESKEFEFVPTCQCGHPVGAHFDGLMEWQACLYEGCECMKWVSR